MAISRGDYDLFRRLKQAGHLDIFDPAILEIGEAEWYGDVPIEEIKEDARRWIGSESYLAVMLSAIDVDAHRIAGGQASAHVMAKNIYRIFFGTSETIAIDMHGTLNAMKLDLNVDWSYGKLATLPTQMPQHDIVYNTGTAEHIFRIGTVLEMIHDVTAVNGLMIYTFPFTGWVDHGFYNINPTLVLDLARANEYEILEFGVVGFGVPGSVWAMHDDLKKPAVIRKLCRLAADANGVSTQIHVAMRKTSDAEFRIPRQAVYDDEYVSRHGEILAAWKENR